MSRKVVIMLGPPGAGKGTQAQRISAALSLPHVSTGDLFRENLSRDSELGKEARQYMDAGELVPDQLVIEMLFDRVAGDDCSSGYLLDGFPRTTAQAEALGAKLAGNHTIRALNLEVPDDAIVGRAAGRLMCDAGHTFHTEHNPPAIEGVCDRCGKALARRKDDDAQVVQQRLKVYHEQTAPLIDFYGRLGVLESVNGEQTPDQVFDDLKQHLEETG